MRLFYYMHDLFCLYSWYSCFTFRIIALFFSSYFNIFCTFRPSYVANCEKWKFVSICTFFVVTLCLIEIWKIEFWYNIFIRLKIVMVLSVFTVICLLQNISIFIKHRRLKTGIWANVGTHDFAHPASIAIGTDHKSDHADHWPETGVTTKKINKTRKLLS